MKPLDLYRIAINNKGFEYNVGQHVALKKLNEFYDAIVENQQENLLSNITNNLKKLIYKKSKQNHRAFYIWGSVGSGKTFIMDTFYHSLQIPKSRMHYHDFLKYIDNKMRYFQGEVNPVKSIVKDIIKKTTILCIDEMCINEISDAITTINVLEALVQRNLWIIITSNSRPDDIYKNGIQRERIINFIERIKSNFSVIELSSERDYRAEQKIGFMSKNSYPVKYYTSTKIKEIFFSSSQEKDFDSQNVIVLGREFPVIKESRNVLWADFSQFFGRPRSKHDYLEIVKRYDTIIVSEVAYIKESQKNILFCFVQFIDIIYDLRKTVIISVKLPLRKIYTGRPYKKVFDRTVSRLKEMSRGYDIY